MKWLKIGSFEGCLRVFSVSEIDWISTDGGRISLVTL